MRFRIALTLGVLGFGAVMLIAAPVLAASHSVVLKNIQFNPRTITVAVGDIVTWTHEDGSVMHSVTAVSGQAESFDSSSACPPSCMQNGQTFSHKFTHVGTFVYFCRIHCPNNGCGMNGMRGTIVVKALTAARTPTPRPKPAPTRAPARAAAPVRSRPQPSASSSPTPTPTPTPALAPTPSPASSPLAAPKTSKTSGRGAIVGGGIAAIALAASGGALTFLRLRRRA
jgi:plastocyanin